jgi:hypothetical protein
MPGRKAIQGGVCKIYNVYANVQEREASLARRYAFHQKEFSGSCIRIREISRLRKFLCVDSAFVRYFLQFVLPYLLFRRMRV